MQLRGTHRTGFQSVDSAFSLPASVAGSFQPVVSEIEEIPRHVEG